MQSTNLSRRGLLQGAVLTAGAAAFLRTALTPAPARAQMGDMPSGTVHSFSTGGVTVHSYVSPAQAVHVTSHVLELGDELLVCDATMIPPTAAEVAALIASTGKPVHTAYVSHEHPDHWGGVAAVEGITYKTLPQIREAIAAEAANGEFAEPTSLLQGENLALGTTEIGGVTVEFRHYEATEAPHIIVAVLPEQKIAIVQDLVYNGVFFAPGVDRQNWIATLETLRDDPAFETLLVGHGLPTTRGEFHTAIEYLKVMDRVWQDSANPAEFIETMKASFPGYAGEFLLSLAEPYWDR